jgi:hypothetical protein
MAYIRGTQVRPELGAGNFGPILAGGQQKAAYIQQGMAALGQGLAQGIQGYNQKKQEKKLTDDAVKFIVDSKMFGEVSPEQARAGVNAIGAQQFMSVLSSMEQQAQSLAAQQNQAARDAAIADTVNKHTNDDGQVNLTAVYQGLSDLGIAGQDVTERVNTMTKDRVFDPAGERAKKQKEAQFQQAAALVDQYTKDGRVDMVALRKAMIEQKLTDPEVMKFVDSISGDKVLAAPVVGKTEVDGTVIITVNGQTASVRPNVEDKSLVVDAAGLRDFEAQYPKDQYGYTAEPQADGTFKLKSMSPRSGNDPFAQLIAALSVGTGAPKAGQGIPPPPVRGPNK